MRLKKQQLFILSVITAVSVCAGSFPSYAEANENFADTGLCAHHSEHTEACGYAAPGEESPCSYGVNGCAYCVVSWEWPEDQQILTVRASPSLNLNTQQKNYIPSMAV